jgi:hypothetical protein
MGVKPIEVLYIGGHPEYVYTNREGLIVLQDNNFEFRETPPTSFQVGSKEGFKIRLEDLEKVSLETKESLALTRMALVGMFAFALKKKTN